MTSASPAAAAEPTVLHAYLEWSAPSPSPCSSGSVPSAPAPRQDACGAAVTRAVRLHELCSSAPALAPTRAACGAYPSAPQPQPLLKRLSLPPAPAAASRAGDCCSSWACAAACQPFAPSPYTPPLLRSGPDAPRDLIHTVCRALDLTPGTTLRLALHIWRRVEGMARLLVSVRRVPCGPALGAEEAVAGGRHAECAYAVAAVWVASKLEERRREVPVAPTLCIAARTCPAVLAAMELRVMSWLEWAPYAGYVHEDAHLLQDF
ncbi:hypothetical protein HYH03_004599 [Edaphochlamys debaryana]|uniref:Uncharacterized protein n=1 Tax=Edaphochlamys debaryana TaxID=47281 RepID=A0A835Y968_9CHLO|nr:hypothetical protein HYH03_004599 [Edaphochlamys debaryana]|eukprot:KAG2497444.1 hypothetical protein HYH03_004599 [Edaphochlamys debaryana]